MKTMVKILLILGLLACILNISSADNATAPSTNEVNKPNGQVSEVNSSDVPSSKDLAKAADPSFAASELETPVQWLMSGLYYIWHYAIYDPISLAFSAVITPITLPINAVVKPITLVLSPILNPIEKFVGKQYNTIKNLIWWITLESISYGSGATAETVSEAMQLAMDGILQFFTDIGLPLANSAEKLAKLTDQLAKTRSKRSVTDSFSDLGGGIISIIRFPFSLLGDIFSIFTFPIRMIFGMVKLPYSLLFGSSDENSTYSLLLTDMNTERITNIVLDEIWKFLKYTGLPELDVIAKELIESDMVPKKLKDMLSEFDSMYKVMKMFGYIK